MKLFLIGLTSLVSLNVHALSSSELKNSLNESSQKPQNYLIRNISVPMKHPGQMRAKIVKKTFVQDDNSSYHWDEKTVCQVESLLEVQDFRIGDNPIAPITSLACDSVINGSPVQVYVGGLMGLENYQVFDNEAKADLKSAGGFLSYKKDPKDTNLINPFDIVATREMGLKSFLFSLQPAVMCTTLTDDTKKLNGKSSATTCTTNEYFSATVEFIDLAPQQ